MNAVALLLPDFALILIGVALYRWAGFDEPFWRGLERLVYFVLFPAMLFSSIAAAGIDLAATANLIGAALGAVIGGLLLGLATVPLFRPQPILFASGLQTAFRFNSYIALATAGRLGGAEGVTLMALIMSFVVPVCNIASVTALARHGTTGLWRGLITNPLLLATISGLLFNLAGGVLPDIAAQTLSRLGSASIALGLTAVGAGLRFEHQIPERRMVGWFIATKLVAMPAIAWVLADLLHLPPLQRQIVIGFAALPTAPAAYILAVRMGGDGHIVAFLITTGTLLSLVTLPLWLSAVS